MRNYLVENFENRLQYPSNFGILFQINLSWIQQLLPADGSSVWNKELDSSAVTTGYSQNHNSHLE